VKKPRDKTESLILSGLDLIQQALTIYDHNLRLAICNSRFQEMFDLPEHLVTPGAGFAETLRFLAERGEYGTVDDIDAFIEERVKQARAFEPHYMERRRANGRMISVEGNPLRQGGWVTVYTDITAIKRQEELLRSHSAQLSDQLLSYSEELARANRELEATISALESTKRQLTESEQLARMTTEMMPAHIAHLDMEECYSYSNRRLPDIVPGRPESIVGLSAREALGDEVYEAIRPYLKKAYEGRASVFEFTHSQGARRARSAFTPDRADNGEIQGVYILSMDITEEAMARAALAQTHKRELAAQLTSGLAHDFANLLTIILGLQGRMEKLPDLPDAAREMIATTRAAAQRGGILLDRLSNVSGPRKINPGACDIGQLLNDIKALASPSMPPTVNLSCSVNGVDRPVILDSGFLQDSLLNLLLNARDAIGEGPGEIRVLVKTVGGIWLEIRVTDTGPGFTNEALEHALDPFYTTKRNDEGSGLGLSMVYDFAQLSGGHLKIGNRPEGGAVVTLRLPLKFGRLRPSPRLILLVEDSPEIRVNTREMLRELGHNVLEATSADEAETLASIPGIDAVLTDITLDGTRTGLDLARSLARRKTAPQIYMMTSLPVHNAVRQQAETEFPLIGKPFSTADLANFLETGSHA
jgi:Signal transduction histidine kinase